MKPEISSTEKTKKSKKEETKSKSPFSIFSMLKEAKMKEASNENTLFH